MKAVSIANEMAGARGQSWNGRQAGQCMYRSAYTWEGGTRKECARWEKRKGMRVVVGVGKRFVWFVH